MIKTVLTCDKFSVCAYFHVHHYNCVCIFGLTLPMRDNLVYRYREEDAFVYLVIAQIFFGLWSNKYRIIK